MTRGSWAMPLNLRHWLCCCCTCSNAWKTNHLCTLASSLTSGFYIHTCLNTFFRPNLTGSCIIGCWLRTRLRSWWSSCWKHTLFLQILALNSTKFNWTYISLLTWGQRIHHLKPKEDHSLPNPVCLFCRTHTSPWSHGLFFALFLFWFIITTTPRSCSPGKSLILQVS